MFNISKALSFFTRRQGYQGNRVSDEIATRTPEWADQLDKNSLLVLVHIPKCGGTSMKAYLHHVYGRFLMTYHGRWHGGTLEQATAESVKDILCITSHQPYGIHRLFGRTPDGKKLSGDGLFEGRDIRYMTVVREPVERMVSMYNFVTTFPAHRHYAATKDMDIRTFYQFLQDINDPELSNGQCHLVTGGTSRRFEDAKRYIDEKYFLAAPLEETEAFLNILASRMGWPKDAGKYTVRNVSPKAHKAETLDADIVDMLAALNAEDAKLYAYVRDQFAQEVLSRRD